MSKVKIRVTSERLNEFVSVEDFSNLEDGKIKGVRNVLSCFVVDENGKYVEKEEGIKMLGSLTLSELATLGNHFISTAWEVAAADPKALKASIEHTSRD